MSSSVELVDRRELLHLPAARPLDEAAWRTWQQRNRLRDLRSAVVHRRGLMWISMAVLLATAGLWVHAEQYQAVIRFAVALSVTGALFAAVHSDISHLHSCSQGWCCFTIHWRRRSISLATGTASL